MSLKFVPRGSNNNIPALVEIMAWRRPGDKPLSERMMVRLPTHICVTRPQWVKWNFSRARYGVSFVNILEKTFLSWRLSTAAFFVYLCSKITWQKCVSNVRPARRTRRLSGTWSAVWRRWWPRFRLSYRHWTHNWMSRWMPCPRGRTNSWLESAGEEHFSIPLRESILRLFNEGRTTMTTRCAPACSQALPVKPQGVWARGIEGWARSHDIRNLEFRR